MGSSSGYKRQSNWWERSGKLLFPVLRKVSLVVSKRETVELQFSSSQITNCELLYQGEHTASLPMHFLKCSVGQLVGNRRFPASPFSAVVS